MPSGLVIPKLGVQATASSDSVNGVICLKVRLKPSNYLAL